MADGAGRAAGDILDATMPFLRRYGRALTACRMTGDGMALRARLSARKQIRTISAKCIRLLLFREMHIVWTDTETRSLSLVAARSRLSNLTPGALETILLRAIEGFSFTEIAHILDKPDHSIAELFETALHEISYRHRKRVLLLEDDAHIAMDMANCISDMGCVVTGVARTAIQAVELAQLLPPHLVMANWVLADQSSGRLAAKWIKQARDDVDVVFMARHPETLLTGEGEEPTFVIPKPYLVGQVRNAVSQALILSRS